MEGLICVWIALAAAQVSPSCQLSVDSARAAFTQRNYNVAANDFRRALDACPQQQALRLELARALFMLQRFDEAQKLARAVLADDAHSIPALLLLANSLYLSGEEPEAVATFQRVIEIDPKNGDAIYSLGRVYYQQNRFEQAITQFRRLLELDPKSYKAYDNLGLCYEALGKEDEAIRHFLQALDLVYKDHPEYDWPYANLANLLLKRGENQKAFQLASEAAVRNPASARNFYLTGKALSRLEKLDLAVKWLKQSVELDPTYPEPRYLLGQVLMKLGKAEEAQREFQAFEDVRSKPRPRR